MIIDADEHFLAHYGILRKSGRYPWGSGGNSETRSRDFLGMIKDLKDKGMSEAEIMNDFGMNTSEWRAAKSIARTQVKQADIATAERLKAKGYSNTAIGEKMGLNESSVRALLAPGQKLKADVLETTAGMLKEEVAKNKYVDIGTGTELYLGVSDTKLKTAVARLQEEGYTTHYVKVEQLGTGQQTTIKVLAGPGVKYSEVYKNRADIQPAKAHSNDGGQTYERIQPPKSISSKRVAVRYKEQGGADADGVIYVRPGVKDISLGGARYAQVRIAVDGTHYLKGMAMYKDDLPPGVDLMFNTNKSSTGNKLDAMKEMKRDKDGNVDMENPFGASIKPGGQRGVHNIVNEEGDWEKWSRTLSSQMLSKQSPKLAKTQLDMTYDRKKRELDEIMALTNPSVRQKLLDSFADDVDSSAVHLKAHHLPRQGNHVILPIHSMKEHEIYAPNYRNGEKVVLIRHPHGGIFEIPELTVNNRHPQAKKLLGNAADAVGINPKTAEKLSGADFDGDTVLVIPNNQGKVKSAQTLEGLKNFDPKMYKLPADSPIPRMTARQKQTQMGVVSNLITDMTIKGANTQELARAVRHSMVVIDAEKHELNWKQSAIDNGIKQLQQKYQHDAKTGRTGGASTLISRASSDIRVPERKQGYRTDPLTGKKVYTQTDASFVNKEGKLVTKTTKSKKLAEAEDAYSLSSGTPMEDVYAAHSNKLKSLANQARKASSQTKYTPYSPSARKVYDPQVKTLDAKLHVALKNAPLERRAQLVANAIVTQKRQANPDMDHAELKKVKAQALAVARARTGASKKRVEITDAEWEAIQAGAISTNKLNQILDNSDLDQVKQKATPREKLLMTNAKEQRALAMAAAGYTQAEIADALGVSLTTLKRSLGGG